MRGIKLALGVLGWCADIFFLACWRRRRWRRSSSDELPGDCSAGLGAVRVRFRRVLRVVGETALRGVRSADGMLDATAMLVTCSDSLGRGRAARVGGRMNTVLGRGLGGGAARSMLLFWAGLMVVVCRGGGRGGVLSVRCGLMFAGH